MRFQTTWGAPHLKVLLIHNFYQLRGGECAVFESEQRMLRAAGHEVLLYTRHSDEISQGGTAANISLPVRTIWNPESHRALKRLVARESPDVAHFTNTFPLVSPSAYYACRGARVPIVQSLHNYRWLCPAATFFRDGQICEECVEHSVLRSVRYGCYRNSRPASAVVASLIGVHRRRSLFELVDRFIVLTRFAREKFAAAGMPEGRIAVKPNSADAGSATPTPLADRQYALYSGRLSAEKGLHTLLDAWKLLPGTIPLRIAGDGPLRSEIERRIDSESIANIRLVGRLPHEDLLETLRHARALVFPSLWYEGMPMAIVEAFSNGIPPIASRLGGMAEMIDEGENGMLFRAGDPADLASKVQAAFGGDEAFEALGNGARRTFESKHRTSQDCERLIEIYGEAISAAQTPRD
jgi:glycosyltransferase involved in cell wall biosynthesis